MSDTKVHQAMRANRLSMTHAMAGDKDAWLDLYSDDAVLADPVGVSPLDPSGEGHKGKAAIAAFWDTVIAPAKLKLTAHQRIESGDRTCAVSMTAMNDLGNGIKTSVDMIAVYEVDEAGKICSMKAYWSWDEMTAQLKALGLA